MKDGTKPKCLFWLKGSIITDEEKTQAHALRDRYNVVYRNAFYGNTGGIEECALCAGLIPERYAERFPTVEEYEASIKRKIGDEYMSTDGRMVRLEMTSQGPSEVPLDPPTPQGAGAPTQPPFEGPAKEAARRRTAKRKLTPPAGAWKRNA